MELDLWVRAQKQDVAWGIAKQPVLTPARFQPQPKHLVELFAETEACGIPHSVAFLVASVETG
jgi:hypothetical protein